MKTSKKWVHFIGICGVTMAPLAHMFKKMGWFVSGSDRGIFPPMSDYLKSRSVDIELGFKEDHLKKDYYKRGSSKPITHSSQPDIVVVGNYIGLNNVEYKFAKKNNLTIKSFPEILEEYLIKSNSVVTAGTYGKTTTTALLALIFTKAKKNPSYMIGGLAKNFKDGILNTKGRWSIVEGDEYISSRFDPVSKFFHYKTEFLLLTACSWDHTDFYKTSEDYVNNFIKLVEGMPKNGIVVANRLGENIEEVIKHARCKVVTYELNNIDQNIAEADWFNLPHKENEREIVLYNRHSKEEFKVTEDLIGDHNRENIIGCCALARELGLSIESIQEAVKEFKGIKRRLEVRFEEENIRVIDDFACSPLKVLGSLKALRNEFHDWHITVIFEPNVGNRTFQAQEMFKGVFDIADEVIIPHLKPVKTRGGDERVTGKQLAQNLENFDINVKYISDDEKLVNYVSGKEVGKHVICFMGSYGWRNIIEEVMKAYSK